MTSRFRGFWGPTCGALIAALLLASVNCGSGRGGNKASQPADEKAKQPAGSAVAKPGSDEDRTVLAVSEAIRQSQLLKLQDECVSYRFDGESSKEYFLVEVRENHGDPKCEGDPNTAPRLFTVRVARQTGEMSTDAGSATGEFHALPPR